MDEREILTAVIYISKDESELERITAIALRDKPELTGLDQSTHIGDFIDAWHENGKVFVSYDIHSETYDRELAKIERAKN